MKLRRYLIWIILGLLALLAGAYAFIWRPPRVMVLYGPPPHPSGADSLDRSGGAR